MTNYESIQQVLRAIDQQENFAIKSEADIPAMLRNCLTESETPLDEKSLWEFYAFTLVENSSQQQRWNGYFASPFLKTVENVYSDRIPLEKITCALINYWKQRVNEVKHPLLKARYAGLVWDFEYKVCGTKPDFHNIANPYIENLILSVDRGSITGLPYCRQKLSRALSLATAFNNPTLKKKAIHAVISYHQKNVTANPDKFWLIKYELLVAAGYIKKGDVEYQPILDELEQKFSIICAGDHEGRIDLNAVDAFFTPLLNEYKSVPEKLKPLLNQIEAAYEKYISNKSAGEMIHWLERLSDYYQLAGIKTS